MPHRLVGQLLLGLCLLPMLSQAAPTLAQRRQAAISTATNQAYCRAITPFYWEIGDHKGAEVSASQGHDAPTADTVMPIASASKWLFGAYVVQRRQGKLSDSDIQYLTMHAGYTHFSNRSCVRLLPKRRDAETVEQCFDNSDNNNFDASHANRFFYNGGQFQAMASQVLDLGNDNNAQLATDMTAELGNGITFHFGSPQLAGGVQMSAANYAVFLRALLDQHLLLGSLLGSHAVCTNPATCSNADYTPVSENESWHYSLAHWVEDDPAIGDGTFSSPGAFGFYPWIDADKHYYGILARHSRERKAYYQSVQCGRLIRKAWENGQAQ